MLRDDRVTARAGPVRPGTQVEVRSTYDGRWCNGFGVAEALEGEGAYPHRRLSDGVVLPTSFSDGDIVRETGGWLAP